MEKQIQSAPKQFPILPEKGNEEVYSYVRGLAKKILNTGKVAYKDEFAWEVKIIDDKKTLNAFVPPEDIFTSTPGSSSFSTPKTS
ncbi:MAG: hypothetical protein IPG32_01390 [Saprospirales bacterium]|nr:hypothetical protein [Saprospirales bacterium]